MTNNTLGRKADSDQDSTGKSGRMIKARVKVAPTPIAGRGVQKEDIRGEGIMSKTISADPKLEYVASGGYLWLNHYLRSLPWYIDDLQRDFGNDIYERMLADPKVKASFNTLKTSILREGIEVLPAEDLKNPSQPEQPSLSGKRPRQSSPTAIEIANFCKRNLDAMGGAGLRSFYGICYELLDGGAFGTKVGELIFNEAAIEVGTDRIIQTLKTIKVKPRTSTAFVVDAYANVVGLLGLIPGQGYPVIVQGLMGRPGDVPNMLPREKFCIFTWMPTDEDPRGNSQLRSAYQPWWFKMQNLGERLKFLVRFATPSVWGTVSERAMPTPMADGNGNPLTDINGNPIMIQPAPLLQNALLGLQNGTVGVGPYGTEIELLEAKGEGEAFHLFQNDCDRDISEAILYQALATGEAQEGNLGSGGGADAHQDILELPIHYGKRTLANMIAHEICRAIVIQNYGEEALPLLPVISLGDVESHNFAEMAAPLAQLGYSVDESQFDGIDSDLGLPAREVGWRERKAKEAAAMTNPQPGQKSGNDGK